MNLNPDVYIETNRGYRSVDFDFHISKCHLNNNLSRMHILAREATLLKTFRYSISLVHLRIRNADPTNQ